MCVGGGMGGCALYLRMCSFLHVCVCTFGLRTCMYPPL